MILQRFTDLFVPKVSAGFLGAATAFLSSPIGGALTSSVLGGVLGGSSSGGKQTQTQTSDPWSAQQPYLKDIFQQAQALNQDGPADYYGGPITAGTNANLDSVFSDPTIQTDGQFLGGLRDNTAAMSGASNVYDQGLANQVANNPFVQQQVDSVASDVNRNASTQMAQNNMNAGMFGNTGSSSTGVQNALVQQDANRTIGDASTSLRGNAYNQGVNAGFQGAGNRLTSLGMQSQNNLSGLQTLYTQSANNFDNSLRAGTAEYGVNQDGINAELAKWDYNANAQWDNLAKYRAAIAGNYGGTSTSSAPNPTSTGEGLLGGAMAGFGLYDKFSKIK